MKVISYKENFELMINLPHPEYDNDHSDKFSKALTENGFIFSRNYSYMFFIIVNVQSVEVINRLLNDIK